jgi:hypothetical protein
MTVDTVDQLNHIDNFLFITDDLEKSDYFGFFIEKLRLYWLEDNSYRLDMNHFKFRQGEEYQHIRMSIADPKPKEYSK